MVASEHLVVLRNAAVLVLVLLFGYITTIVDIFVFHIEIVFLQLKDCILIRILLK